MTGKAAVVGGARTAAATRLRARSAVAALTLASMALLATILAGVAVGPVGVAPVDVVKVLLRHALSLDLAVPALADTVVWEIRLPRVVLAALVGATLAYSGGAYQGVFRNPLADPYLIGVASGAGLAATAVMVSPLPVTYGNFSLITLAAFGGALAAVALTYALARVGGTAPVTTLILAGVAVSALAVSATSYLMLANQGDTIRVLSWLLGSFNDSSWQEIWLILPYTLPAAAVTLLHARVLNVMQLDEHEAKQLGVHVERTRLIVLCAASLAAAAAVAVAGIIGFVGLVVPHVARLLVGPDYRRLLPIATLLGAAFLVLADLGARTAVRPGELPIGIVTAFFGAPYFLFLLRRQRRSFF